MKIHYAEAFEDVPLTLMDRITNVAGANITQETIATIAFDVFEYGSQGDAESDTNQTIVSTATSLTVADVVFDTLQTAAPWDAEKDSTGYNFKFVLPKAARPNGRKWHRVEVLFTPVSGESFVVVWIIETKALARS